MIYTALLFIFTYIHVLLDIAIHLELLINHYTCNCWRFTPHPPPMCKTCYVIDHTITSLVQQVYFGLIQLSTCFKIYLFCCRIKVTRFVHYHIMIVKPAPITFKNKIHHKNMQHMVSVVSPTPHHFSNYFHTVKSFNIMDITFRCFLKKIKFLWHLSLWI